MSGIRSGSRLQQLYTLQARLTHEIAAEQAREADNTAARWDTPPTPPTPTRKGRTPTPTTLLDAHGITARQVKDWALAEGLITHIRRGHVSIDLIHTYLDAHQNGHTP